MQKKAIVVGANGMDGKTITHFLLRKGYKVVGTFRRATIDISKELHSINNFNPNLSFDFCEINDFESVKNLIEKHHDANEVYLLAAQSNVGYSFNTPDYSVITNGMSVYNFLESINKFNKKIRLYFAGTSELLGGNNPETPYTEDSQYDCRSPYSIGKELGTRWIKYYRQLGIFCCYGILFNHSNQYRDFSFFIRRVTNTAAKIAHGQEKELVLGNLDFYRDEHWSDFGCEMMWKMLQMDDPEDYIIATGETHHGTEYLDLAFSYFNLDWKKFVKQDKSRFRPNEVIKLVGDSSKAQEKLGWNPKRMSFKDHINLMCMNDSKIVSTKTTYDFYNPSVFEIFPE